MSLALDYPNIANVGVTESGLGFYEFFAGSGMARIGLGSSWKCLFANDFDSTKCAAYASNFSCEELVEGDISALDSELMPKGGKLAWASFPCQDLSLAGSRTGLRGERSGTFWSFWQHITNLASAGSPIPIIALENVVGLLSSRGGEDFRDLVRTLSRSYQVSAAVIDAVHWLPQSRPRLFIVAVLKDIEIPWHLRRDVPRLPWHTPSVVKAFNSLDRESAKSWLWLDIPSPQPRELSLEDIIEASPEGVSWHTADSTRKLLEMMSPANLAKVEEIRKLEVPTIGTIYKRTRPNQDGTRQQRAEVRFDGVSGCLRTPSGGSSRQTLLVVNGEQVRSRLISPREAARLMGLPDSYVLPKNYNDAYHLAGDGVAVPVVEWLQRHVLTPIAEAT